jgi:GNAT superfamily N-acetyltransferase
LLQKTVFPTLSEQEIIRAKHYRNHIRLFPEGQFVILDGSKVIGMTSTMRYHYELAAKDHSFLDISANLWLTTHLPDGEWLYGQDVGIHPAYRKRGLGRAIYQARQALCHQLGLKGQMTVGMLNGYLPHASEMSIETYCDLVIKNEINDPTVSVQRKFGFEPIKLIKNYLQDPQCGNAGVLLTLPVDKTV